MLKTGPFHIIGAGNGLKNRPYLYVIASAVLYGLSIPASKVLLRQISPIALAGLLYLGAFIGLAGYSLGKKLFGKPTSSEAPPLERRDYPWLAGAILSGGILGPICLLSGLAIISGYAASLLQNLEGVATALIAVVIFKENAGRRIWLALVFMTCAGIFLSWDPGQNKFAVSGSLLVLAGVTCWGLDNNLTRRISDKNPVQISRIKVFIAGVFNLAVAGALGLTPPFHHALFFGLILGALSYGLSLVLFIKALQRLGSFRTGAFFSFAPFAGALVSLAVLPEPAKWVLAPGALFMVVGVYLIINEKHAHDHRHEKLVHAHAHGHGDGHHLHPHEGKIEGPHSHEHAHEEMDHIHGHWPDIHHRHKH